jgi:hypothetical protein
VEELRLVKSKESVSPAGLIIPAKMGYFNMLDLQHNCRPFLAEEGYVGLTPDYAQKENVIVILFGAKFPYIIRKHSADTYTLIGEAYVHGIMYGEYMDEKRQEVVFTLT